MKADHTPMAEVGENAVFFLRKQENGERWPAGTKLYAETPLIISTPLLLSTLKYVLRWHDQLSPADIERMRAAIKTAINHPTQGA